MATQRRLTAAQRAHAAGELLRWARRNLPCPDPMNVFERDSNLYWLNKAQYFPEIFLKDLAAGRVD